MARARRARASSTSRYRAVGEGAALVLNSAVAGLFGQVRDQTELILTRIEDRALVMRTQLVRLTFASILIGIGVLVLLTALLLYLVDTFTIRWPTALLITGIVMIIIAYIIRAGRKW